MTSIKKNTIYPLLFSGLICLIALCFMTSDERYIAVPAFVCCLFVLWLFLSLYRRNGVVPFFDAGMICALVTMVYTVVPLVNYWSGGMQFGRLSDLRLQSINPSPLELGLFHWRHVLYLGTFVVVYAVACKKSDRSSGQGCWLDRPAIIFILIFFFIAAGYIFIFQVFTTVDITASYEKGINQENIAKITYLPLIVKQITFKLMGILLLCKIAVLQLLIPKIKEKKWRIIFWGWLIFEAVQPVLTKSSRTEAAIFILAAGLLYHRLVKPFTWKFLTVAGTAALAAFLFLGVFRQTTDLSSAQRFLEGSTGGILEVNNEFQTLLGTAYDVIEMKNNGKTFPWYVYINDIITIFPPQQFITFEKIQASGWYLREIGAEGSGQGYMWGVISQAAVGLDWIELVLRGVALGLLLAWLHRWYMRKSAGFFPTLFYVYLCLRVYYTFRDTTFSLLGFLVWEVIPFYLLVKFGRRLIPRKLSQPIKVMPSRLPRCK